MKHLLLYLIQGTRGGETRAKIINAIKKKPQNANKLAKSLSFDYKTIQHHLNILEENRIFSVIKKGKYGAMYFLSEEMEQNVDLFEDIWEKFGY